MFAHVANNRQASTCCYGKRGKATEIFPIKCEKNGRCRDRTWDLGQVATFKAAFGRFAPEFDNYSQQDAQEFLVRLLDALHEDTNLVKWPKP